MSEDSTTTFTGVLDRLGKLVVKPPKSLYHYTNAKALISILKEEKKSHIEGNKRVSLGCIRLTQSDFLNDPTEVNYARSLVEKFLSESKPDKCGLISYLKELSREEKAKAAWAAGKLYVASFTKDSDNLSMWKYYASAYNNDGYCIEFDQELFTSSLKAHNRTMVFMALGVFYGRDIFKEEVPKYFNILNEADCSRFSENEVKNLYRHLYDNLIYIVPFLKHPSYAGEEEFRVVCRVVANGTTNFIEKNGIVIPYVLAHYNRESIKSITISPALSNRNALPGLETLVKEYGLSCQVTQSEIPFRNI